MIIYLLIIIQKDMKIGIDARPLSAGKFTGIPFYEYMILKEWMKSHPEHEYYLFSLKPICWGKEELPENWHIVDKPGLVKNEKLRGPWWFAFTVPRLIKKLKLNIYWGPNFSMPRKVRGVSYYVTIHDLGIYHFEHIGQRRNEIQIKLFLPRNIKNARKVLTVSEFTKKDVVQTFSTPVEKIETIYNGGIVEKITGEEETSSIRNEIKELEDFFLFIGTIEPRKNVPTIIKGYEIYMDKYIGNCMDDGKCPKLVLAGGKGWNCEEIYQMIEQSKYRQHIIMTGYISGSEKEYLLNNATCFIYPSLYEGFGIPVLEAFAVNTPVITANNSSLPEVGGEAALYIDTYDSEGLAEKINEVINMKDEDRESLSTRMRAQLCMFSWVECAEETLAVILGDN